MTFDYTFNSAVLTYSASDVTVTAPSWTGGFGYFSEITNDLSGVSDEFLALTLRENAGNNVGFYRVEIQSADLGGGTPTSIYEFDLGSLPSLAFSQVVASTTLDNPAQTINGGADLSAITVIQVALASSRPIPRTSISRCSRSTPSPSPLL